MFTFLGASCGAVAEGGVAPTPLAWGVGVLRAEQWELADPFWSYTGPQPAGRYRNSIKSNDVFDDDGNKYRVVTTANYRVAEDGSSQYFKHAVEVIQRG